MGYLEWFEAHGRKHRKIVEKLENLSDNEVVEYFRFKNMVVAEPDFCPLYAKNRKCHDIENLNCYLCACPHFRFDDDGLKKVDGKTLKSVCSIDAKESRTIEHDEIIHLDCSLCLLPHRESFIKKNFSRDWFEIMERVAPKSRLKIS